MRHKLLLTTLAVVLSLPFACRAADSDTVFNSIDTDKSDTLSLDEFVKAPLAALESPSGKKLVPLGTPKSRPLSKKDKKRLFNQLDTDHNGTIDHKEWKHASPDGFVVFRF